MQEMTEREWLESILPKNAHKRISEILEHFEPEPIQAVEVPGARCPVERVEVHGIVIGVDANGRAVRVEFPEGAEVA